MKDDQLLSTLSASLYNLSSSCSHPLSRLLSLHTQIDSTEERWIVFELLKKHLCKFCVSICSLIAFSFYILWNVIIISILHPEYI